MGDSLFKKRLGALVAFHRRHKRVPTYEEFADLFGLASKGSVYKYVRRFEDAGMLSRDSDGRLVATPGLYGTRVLGEVQAGWPSPAEEELVDTMSLDEFLIDNPQATYMLKVSGDSMVNAGIQPGDMVLVDRSRNPRHGDIVIAQVDDEWTMKRYMKYGKNVLLRAANRKYSDIRPRNELKVAGVVSGVIRKYA